jgi:hypothetical protein
VPSLTVSLAGFDIALSLQLWRDGAWITLPGQSDANGFRADSPAGRVRATIDRSDPKRITWVVWFTAPVASRLRIVASLSGAADVFHLIPGCIHGDNNAAHVHPGHFPVLSTEKPWERHRAPLWEFRADRASHPISALCTSRGAVAVEIDPYSDCPETPDDAFIRNGVIAALPNQFGVSIGYGNDPQTFHNKTVFWPATHDLSHGASARVTLHAQPGDSRRAVHDILRRVYDDRREKPTFKKTYLDALAGLSDAFANVNYSAEVGQYTNRKTRVAQVCTHTCAGPAATPTAQVGVPTCATQIGPFDAWRAIVEIAWTGGVVLAYPFALAEQFITGFAFPKSPHALFDEIAEGFNEQTGFINDTCVNRSTQNRPEGWNASDINGWWSGGILAHTRDNHCAYTNAQAAYYLLKSLPFARTDEQRARWRSTALRVLQSAVHLQRADGAFGYIFSGTERTVIDFDGFAGCWFVPALVLAHRLTSDSTHLAAARRAMEFYARDVRALCAWGSPMDTYKSIDSEGNLAFIRAARLLHEATGEATYLEMLRDAAHYEYLWRYGFRSRPQAPPLSTCGWNSCGGSITSISNPHIHPMSVIATRDLEYLAQQTSDDYHQRRADDGMAWLMQTLELYPDVVGYGRYGVLSERTCPSDGLLEEMYADGQRASTWWSYNAWAAANAMEAVAEQLLAGRTEPKPDVG